MVNKISGKVIVKESGVGIPDLLIVIYDLDPECNLDEIMTSKESLSGTEFWKQFRGDRIGSVLTSNLGTFELSYEDSEFQVKELEKRPDIIILVMAPEEPGSKNQQTPKSPQSLVVYYSNITRVDAGRDEAYVIRLPLSSLKKYNIQIPTVIDPSAQVKLISDRLIEAQVAAGQLNKHVREGLKQVRQEQIKLSRATSQKAKAFVKPLQYVSKRIRSQPNFLTSADNFDETQQYAMKSGLSRIANLDEPYRKMMIALTDEELPIVEDQPSIRDQRPASGNGIELSHDQICNLLLTHQGGPELVRIRELLEARREEAERRQRLDDATDTSNDEPGSDPNGDGDDSTPPEPPDAGTAISNGVLNQISDLTAPRPAAASSIEELSERLTGLRLPVGPADVTAFHDFHQLQIAFEHVWTEAFDESLKGQIRDLYHEIVRLNDEYVEPGEPTPFELPEELNEIMDLKNFLQDLRSSINEPIDWIPDAVRQEFTEYITPQLWNALSGPQRGDVLNIANEIEGARYEGDEQKVSELQERGIAILNAPLGLAPRLTRMLKEIVDKLTEPYAFHYFAPNSVNFGILLTYRQRWEPLTYQVGDLVSTIPLAPGEVRKFSSRTVLKRTRSQKEVEKALSSQRGESSLTQRAEAEITSKASIATNFKLTSQGSFSFGIGSISGSSEFALNQAQESARVKKDFREAVIKTAQEYKHERAVEVQTTDEVTAETTTSGELRNTNNEKSVTYLLYELERQYKISERIHRVTPVILVAQDVPAPNEITESWLLAHEWILRRVLLDDSLQVALNYISGDFAGEEISLSVKQANWETQRRLVEKLEGTVASLISERDLLRTALVNKEEAKALASAREEAQGFLFDLSDELLGDADELRVAEIEARIKKIQKQLEYLDESLGQTQKQLASAKESLDSATQEYTAGIETQTSRRIAIDQLRIHVKDNILYYMQAIWDHEPPDQRFFRLYHIDVKLPEAPSPNCRLRLATEEEIADGLPTIIRDRQYYVIEGCDAPLPPNPDNPNLRKLVEIADIDQPLGYKGNYMIFPLKECVYLTQFMMRQFVDDYFGVRDPDISANFTTEELLGYIESIWKDETVSLTDEEQEALRALVLKRLREPRRDSDIVIVPTGELYIEALVGSHTLLEEFKLIHRAYDVGKARGELRQMEIENLRRAAKLLAGEREDPDIEKKVIVSGDGLTPTVEIGGRA